MSKKVKTINLEQLEAVLSQAVDMLDELQWANRETSNREQTWTWFTEAENILAELRESDWSAMATQFIEETK